MKQGILTNEEILEIVKKTRPNSKRLEIRGRTILECRKHCGMYMRRVRVFYDMPSDCSVHSKKEWRGQDQLVCACRKCGHSFYEGPFLQS